MRRMLCCSFPSHCDLTFELAMAAIKLFIMHLFEGLLVTTVIHCTFTGELDIRNDATLTLADYRTKVFRTGITGRIRPTDPNIHRYDDLICYNEIFVDNSLLIRYVYDHQRMVVTLPRAFGKTINLDMIMFFYGMEVELNTLTPLAQTQTKAYQLFVLGKIKCDNIIMQLKDQFLIKNLQTYNFFARLSSFPIIYINIGQPSKFKSVNDVFEQLRDVIWETLMEHEYIKYASPSAANSTISNYQHTFMQLEALLKSDLRNGKTLTSVVTGLIKLLHLIFQKPIFLMIDEYDAILNAVHFGHSALDATGRDDVREFFASFYGQLIKQNKYIKRVFMTGILCWRGCNIFSSITRMDFHTVSEGDAINFYGMNSEIVVELLNEVDLGHTINMVKKYYNGYHFGSLSKYATKYNPYAISQFIAAKGIPTTMNFWTVTASASSMIKYLLRYSEFHEKFIVLMKGRPIKIDSHSRTTTFTVKELDDFSNAVQQAKEAHVANWFKMKNTAGNFGFVILLATGYLTETDGKIQSCGENSLWVQITNEEVMQDLSTDYLSILRGSPKASVQEGILWRDRLQQFGTELEHFLQAATPDLGNFAAIFELIIKEYIPVTWKIKASWEETRDSRRAYANEAIFETLLTTYINSNIYDIGVQRFETQHMFHSVTDRRRPDVVVQALNKLITIFELKYCSGAIFNPNLIKELLTNGTDQAIGYANWYLTGKYSHIYHATGVKVVVLLVMEYNHRVAMRGWYKQVTMPFVRTMLCTHCRLNLTEPSPYAERAALLEEAVMPRDCTHPYHRGCAEYLALQQRANDQKAAEAVQQAVAAGSSTVMTTDDKDNDADVVPPTPSMPEIDNDTSMDDPTSSPPQTSEAPSTTNEPAQADQVALTTNDAEPVPTPGAEDSSSSAKRIFSCRFEHESAGCLEVVDIDEAKVITGLTGFTRCSSSVAETADRSELQSQLQLSLGGASALKHDLTESMRSLVVHEARALAAETAAEEWKRLNQKLVTAIQYRFPTFTMPEFLESQQLPKLPTAATVKADTATTSKAATVKADTAATVKAPTAATATATSKTKKKVTMKHMAAALTQVSNSPLRRTASAEEVSNSSLRQLYDPLSLAAKPTYATAAAPHASVRSYKTDGTLVFERSGAATSSKTTAATSPPTKKQRTTDTASTSGTQRVRTAPARVERQAPPRTPASSPRRAPSPHRNSPRRAPSPRRDSPRRGAPNQRVPGPPTQRASAPAQPRGAGRGLSEAHQEAQRRERRRPPVDPVPPRTQPLPSPATALRVVAEWAKPFVILPSVNAGLLTKAEFVGADSIEELGLFLGTFCLLGDGLVQAAARSQLASRGGEGLSPPPGSSHRRFQSRH